MNFPIQPGRLFRPQFIFLLLLLAAAFLSGCQPAQETLDADLSPTEAERARPTRTPMAPLVVEDQPELLWEGITLRKVAETGIGSIKLAQHPDHAGLFYLRPTEGIFQVLLEEPFSIEKVVDAQGIHPEGMLSGMKFGPDGSLYVVMNIRPSIEFTQAAVYRGTADASGSFSWETLAMTEPYPASNTNFDHLFNGIAVSPDNQWVYLNSGSRTDHGEVQDNDGAHPDLREAAITSAILRLPADGVDLLVPNDEALLLGQGWLYADGTRNAYDLEFAPNGDLFGIDNGPDADYADELNWIREGAHYGFPWRFGTQDNPQQFADYDPAADNRLSEDFVAVQRGTYVNDPEFPAPPQVFTDPVLNLGPDAAFYRDDDGNEQDAGARGEPWATFTAHRSPLGLVFVSGNDLPADLVPGEGELSLFVLSWGAAGGDLSDQGQDLLHMLLTKDGDTYSAQTHQVAIDFKRPIDAVMIGNQLYVLEWDGDGTIWELTFE